MNTKFYKILLNGVLACIIGMMHTSCSEDITGQPETTGNGTTSLTINIKGFDTGIQTRTGESYHPDDYLVDMYIFSEQKSSAGSGFEGYTYEGKKAFETERLVTLTDLDVSKNYAFIFVGYEPEYKDYKGVTPMIFDEINGAGYSNPETQKLTEGSNYTNTYIEVLDGMNNYGIENGYIYPYEKAEGADDDFMIYGCAFDWAAKEFPSYTPASVTLTRQIGAVVFRTQITADEINETSCDIYSQYYRLYLSQILESKEKGTKNENEDYLINSGSPVQKTFSAPSRENADASKDYIIYVPCTTTRSVDSVKEHPDEYANMESSSGYITSFSINGEKYTTSQPFPVFPNRRTILTLMDDNQLSVSFEGVGGGISYDDEWNGWND